MDVNVFTSPIITDAQGKKFGKSEGNAVWLDGTMLSPYKFYQFWFNRPDSEMENLLKVFTFLPKAEIERLVEESKTNPGAREAQRTLAWEVTSLVHGEEATRQAIEAAGALFGRGGDLAGVDKTIKAGGVYLNNARVEDEEQVLNENDFLHGRFALIRRGKKALGVVENV